MRGACKCGNLHPLKARLNTRAGATGAMFGLSSRRLIKLLVESSVCASDDEDDEDSGHNTTTRPTILTAFERDFTEFPAPVTGKRWAPDSPSTLPLSSLSLSFHFFLHLIFLPSRHAADERRSWEHSRKKKYIYTVQKKFVRN